MKTLLFGKIGQLGWELNRSLLPLGDLVVLDQHEADFTRPDAIRKLIQENRPDIIVNAVAYTAVDRAEEEEALAYTINAETPGVIAEEAGKLGALMVHYSTDYVFNGEKAEPYTETDEPAPINAYGRTKLAGEQAVAASGCDYLTFRTSWVYAARAQNFMLAMLRLAAEREELSIVSDQIGAPTSARLIADTSLLCLQQAQKERAVGIFSPGLYHLSAAGSTSWHGFTEEIVKLARARGDIPMKIKTIKPIPTSAYPTPAQRPMNSCLALRRLESDFSLKMPDWKIPLQLAMSERLGRD